MGELLEFTWRGVDFTRRTVTVTRQTIPVNETVLEVLKENSKVRLVSDRVFCSKAFTPCTAFQDTVGDRLSLTLCSFIVFLINQLCQPIDSKYSQLAPVSHRTNLVSKLCGSQLIDVFSPVTSIPKTLSRGW